MMLYRVLLMLSLALPLQTAMGDLLVSITGTPGSSIVTITISGTGTWITSTAASDNVGTFDGWDADWAGPDLEAGPAIHPSDTAPAITSTLSVDNDGTAIALTGLWIDDDGTTTTDDFALFSDADFSTVLGTTYTFSGSATFDLSTLSSTDIGPTATFDDLLLGTHTSTTASSLGHDVASVTLTISIVPEPSSALMLAAGALLGVAARRRRLA